MSASAPLSASEGAAHKGCALIESVAEGAIAVGLTAADIGATEAEIPALHQDFIPFLPTLPVPTHLSLTLGPPSLASGNYVCQVNLTRFLLFLSVESRFRANAPPEKSKSVKTLTSMVSCVIAHETCANSFPSLYLPLCLQENCRDYRN
jgi:hypothetical protein